MDWIRLALVAVLCTAANASAASLPDVSGKFFPGVEAPAVPAVSPAPVAPVSVMSPGNWPAEPDWSFTPGRLCTRDDSDYKELRYAEQIPYCNRHVTKEMKLQVAAHYGVPESDWKNYEFDHLIPLSLGGNSHVENLWPEPNSQNQGNAGKDQLELQLYLKIRDGKITQAEAVKQIYDWFRTNHPAQAAKMGL
jgi:hypothetical protein